MTNWTNIAKNQASFDTQYLIIGDTFNLNIGDGFILKIQTAGGAWQNISKNSSSWTNITKN